MQTTNEDQRIADIKTGWLHNQGKAEEKEAMMVTPGAQPEENMRQEEKPSAPAAENTHGTPLLVLYGSNLAQPKRLQRSLLKKRVSKDTEAGRRSLINIQAPSRQKGLLSL